MAAQAVSVEGFQVHYKSGPFSPEDADVFLLGEQHHNASTIQKISRVVSSLAAQGPIVLFTEFYPSLFPLPNINGGVSRLYQIDETVARNVTIFGWDTGSIAAFHIRSAISKLQATKEDVWRSPLRISRLAQKMRKVKMNLEFLKAGLIAIKNSMSVEAQEIASAPSLPDYTVEMPARTASLVKTLREARVLQQKKELPSKTVVIAGAGHFAKMLSCADPVACNLDSLYAELSTHRAVVLLPDEISPRFEKVTGEWPPWSSIEPPHLV